MKRFLIATVFSATLFAIPAFSGELFPYTTMGEECSMSYSQRVQMHRHELSPRIYTDAECREYFQAQERASQRGSESAFDYEGWARKARRLNASDTRKLKKVLLDRLMQSVDNENWAGTKHYRHLIRILEEQ